ncbi:hypothetical protein DFR50_10352 [Roseiarcus fermentans]|uniref:N-acetyltransferase domain-containing protein n=1 Tax=Roseiarcus fermentans TaxID=1473586 RepID=A0A366FRH4_9HYPH|nr:hypothetical protein [Roseiarcus fermentans]RBP17167.1 hypothetical protein DFR50_10352 [Roseiarcus fermentans]
MNGFEVRPVRDRAGLDDFIVAARRAEASNRQWVEQVHDEARQMFDAKSIFLKENAVQPFVAYRSGEPVGRIVATVDAGHQKKYGDRCGFFGFIESIDDPACFAALFGAAESFLRDKGMALSRGPFGLNVNGETGLLVEGFDQAHIMQTNHCPPYYGDAIETLGYVKATDLYALMCAVRESNVPERVAREIAKGRAPKIDIRTASYRNFFGDLHTLIDFYNDAWSENRWALPMSRAEADFTGKMMLPIARPGWIYFASYKGELVSVIAQVPDVNEALQGLDGKLFPTGLPTLLWRLHVRGTRRARVLLAATAKKWRDTIVGVAAMGQLMARSIADARKAGVEEVEYSWILEDNRAALAPVMSLPARRTRVFRIYEKQL